MGNEAPFALWLIADWKVINWFKLLGLSGCNWVHLIGLNLHCIIELIAFVSVSYSWCVRSSWIGLHLDARLLISSKWNLKFSSPTFCIFWLFYLSALFWSHNKVKAHWPNSPITIFNLPPQINDGFNKFLPSESHSTEKGHATTPQYASLSLDSKWCSLKGKFPFCVWPWLKVFYFSFH